MSEREWLAEEFEAQRPHLRRLAHRMLGSGSEADDAVQEAWLRLARADAGGIDNLGGWLTTVVARVCLNMLQSRRSRREEPLGEPEPVAGAAALADTFSGRARAARLALVDGLAGAVWAPGGRPRVVFSFKVTRGKIVAIEILADPARLGQLDVEVLGD